MSDNYSNQDLDLSLLNEIADGSDEFIVESIDMFLQQTPELLQEITDGINAQAWEEVSASAHKLKPTLGFFGMLNSQSLIQDIESGCKAGSTPDINEMLLKVNRIKASIAPNFLVLNQLKADAQARL